MENLWKFLEWVLLFWPLRILWKWISPNFFFFHCSWEEYMRLVFCVIGIFIDSLLCVMEAWIQLLIPSPKNGRTHIRAKSLCRNFHASIIFHNLNTVSEENNQKKSFPCFFFFSFYRINQIGELCKSNQIPLHKKTTTKIESGNGFG